MKKVLCFSALLIFFTASFAFCNEQITSDHGIAKRAFLQKKNGEIYQAGNIRWGIKSKNIDKIAVEKREYFWKNASINPNLVDQIFFVLKPFKPKFIAGHGYALITFKDGGFHDNKGFKPEGLVISYEIFKKFGVALKDLDFVHDATHNAYNIAPILATWEDFAAVDCDLAKDKLILYKLLFSQPQKVQFVKNILDASLNHNKNEFYHTLKNSCVTKQLSFINSVLPKKKQISPRILGGKLLNLNGFLPRRIPATYVRKGVMKKIKTRITEKNYFVPLEKLTK